MTPRMRTETSGFLIIAIKSHSSSLRSNPARIASATASTFSGSTVADPVDVVTGGSSGTFNIDSELEGMTELQSGSYCVMDLDYRRIGSPRGAAYDDFEMALTVLTTVISVPTAEMAMVDGGFKAFSTDRPFVPEAVEWPGVEYSWAGDEHGRLMTTEPGRLPRLGQLIEFFPPHCDPTINLYDRIYAMRGDTVEAVWDVAGRGRSQ